MDWVGKLLVPATKCFQKLYKQKGNQDCGKPFPLTIQY